MLSLVLPFYVYLFGMLLVGIVIGGVATWMTQARWRRTARRRAAEAQRWQAEADRLARERQAHGPCRRQLAPGTAEQDRAVACARAMPLNGRSALDLTHDARVRCSGSPSPLRSPAGYRGCYARPCR